MTASSTRRTTPGQWRLPLGGSLARHAAPARGQTGSIIIALVMILLMLSATMMSLSHTVSTSAVTQISSTQWNQATYLAESGYRVVIGNYLSPGDADGDGTANTPSDQYTVLGQMNDSTFNLTPYGTFSVTIRPYWFYSQSNQAALGGRLTLNMPGDVPAGYFDDLPSRGNIMVGGVNYTYDGASHSDVVTANGKSTRVQFSGVASVATLNKGDAVFLATATAEAKTITAHGDLEVEASGSGRYLPEYNGLIQVGPAVLRYEKRVAGSLSGQVKLLNLQETTSGVSALPLAVTDGQQVILQGMAEIIITGAKYPAGDANDQALQIGGQHQITYNVPIQLPQGHNQGYEEVMRDNLKDLNEWDDGMMPSSKVRLQSLNFIKDGNTYTSNLMTFKGHRQFKDGNAGVHYRVGYVNMASAHSDTLERAWLSSDHLLSYDVQIKLTSIVRMQYLAGGLGFRWHYVPSTHSNQDRYQGFGFSLIRYHSADITGDHYEDYIPNAVKPMAVTSDDPALDEINDDFWLWWNNETRNWDADNVYKNQHVLLVFWMKDFNNQFRRPNYRWIAYKDLGIVAREEVYNPDRDRHLDWFVEHGLQVGDHVYDELVIGAQNIYDGIPVNDFAGLQLRLREVKDGAVKKNVVSFFVSDASSDGPNLRGNTSWYDHEGDRRRYDPGAIFSQDTDGPWPVWPPDDPADLTYNEDYFSVIGGTNNGEALAWDALNVDDTYVLQNFSFTDSSKTAIQTTVYTTPDTDFDDGTHPRPEVAMHVFGDYNNQNMLSFDDFAMQMKLPASEGGSAKVGSHVQF